MEILLSLIVALLGIIGYFLKQLHADFRELSKAVIELTTKVALTEEKGRSGNHLLSSKIEGIEHRVEKLELKLSNVK